MMTFHKVIKNLSIILAIFFIVSIFSFLFLSLGSFVSNLENNKEIDLSKDIELSNMNIDNLDIKLKSSKLTIKNGSSFKIETNNENVKATINNKILTIKEDKYQFFHRDDLEVLLYLPSDILFNKVNVEASFASIEVDSLQTNQLTLDLGAGSTSFNSLMVLEKAKVEGGAGEIKILSGMLTNLDLDMGVGKLELTSKLEGNTKIASGVGEVLVNVLEKKDNYTLKLEKGIGSIKVNSEVISNKTLGYGDKLIEIQGGIGSINLNFAN